MIRYAYDNDDDVCAEAVAVKNTDDDDVRAEAVAVKNTPQKVGKRQLQPNDLRLYIIKKRRQSSSHPSSSSSSWPQ